MIEQSVFLQTEQDAVDFTAKVSKYFGDIRMDLGTFVIDAKSVFWEWDLGKKLNFVFIHRVRVNL